MTTTPQMPVQGELVDEHGLTLTQRQFLTVRANSITDNEALTQLGLSPIWLAHQKRQSRPFREALNQLFPYDAKALTNDALSTLLPATLAVISEALASEDNKQRQWAVETLFKAKGIFKTLFEGITTHIPPDLLILREMMNRGQQLPPQAIKRLTDAGLANEPNLHALPPQQEP